MFIRPPGRIGPGRLGWQPGRAPRPVVWQRPLPAPGAGVRLGQFGLRPAPLQGWAGPQPSSQQAVQALAAQLSPAQRLAVQGLVAQWGSSSLTASARQAVTLNILVQMTPAPAVRQAHQDNIAQIKRLFNDAGNIQNVKTITEWIGLGALL